MWIAMVARGLLKVGQESGEGSDDGNKCRFILD
jgi:hypothetical protein